MSEASLPFNQAIHTALAADAVLLAYLGGAWIYSGMLAQDVMHDDFINLDADDTTPWLRFNGLAVGKPREGELCGLMIDCWSRIRRADGSVAAGKTRVLTLAGHVARILNNTQLTMPSYGFVIEGRAEMLTSGKDPEGTLMRARVRLEAYVTRDPGALP